MWIPALVFLVAIGLFPVAVKVGVNLAQRHEARNGRGMKKPAISADMKVVG
jgi:hypothetical protein